MPLTADPALWQRAVALGSEVIWLHTFGERRLGPAGMLPARLDGQARVTVAIPSTPEGMPSTATWTAGELCVGEGRISPVSEAVWGYEVSTMRVLRHWLEYRMRTPAGSRTGPLDRLVATRWSHEWTTELLQVIWVLERLVALEPAQAELLGEIVDGPLVSVADLTGHELLPVPSAARQPPTGTRERRRTGDAQTTLHST